jgi:hypothetical protein
VHRNEPLVDDGRASSLFSITGRKHAAANVACTNGVEVSISNRHSRRRGSSAWLSVGTAIDDELPQRAATVSSGSVHVDTITAVD